MDIVIVNRDHRLWVYHNIAPREHWIMFRVEDVDGGIAHDARVTVTLGDSHGDEVGAGRIQLLWRDRSSGALGLGSQDEVRVTWQDGNQESFGPFRADQIVSLRRTAHR